MGGLLSILLLVSMNETTVEILIWNLDYAPGDALGHIAETFSLACEVKGRNK